MEAQTQEPHVVSSMLQREQLWHWRVSLDLVTHGSEDYWRRLLEYVLVSVLSSELK